MWNRIKDNAPTLYRKFASLDLNGLPTRDVDGFTVPEWWSDNAAMICRTRYANGQLKETSAIEICERMAIGWAHTAVRDGYIETSEYAEFINLYANIMLHQLAAPNSPQWFNTGVHLAGGTMKSSGNWVYRPEGAFQPNDALEYPQVHACFINSVDDSLIGDGSIDDLWTRETKIFKHGSGSGANFSKVREKGAPLSGGGTSSGLMSFLSVGDTNAGAIKSGGTTRRAALMRTLNVDHPDIIDFIRWKRDEEAKVAYLAEGSKVLAVLADGGHVEGVDPAIANRVKRMREEGILEGQFSEMDTGWTSEAYSTVDGQNSNNSVMISDDFMKALRADADWELTSRIDGSVVKSIPAREIWREIAESAWLSADPAVQFYDTINRYNTAKASGQIVATNPCCFVGETLVDTSEGPIRIDELVRMFDDGEGLPMAYCWDEENSLPDLRQINAAWFAGTSESLVRVETEKGRVFECTPEHEWLLRDGQWVEAQDLRVGMSLRKVGKYINEHRSGRRYISHRVTDTAPNGQQLLSRWVYERAVGEIPEGYHVHHLNEDPTDDRVSNLGVMDGVEHITMHSEGENNPRYIDVETEKLVEVYDSVAAMRGKGGRKSEFDGMVTVSRWNNYIHRNNLKGIIPLANKRGIRGMTWDEFCQEMEGARELVNDKVKSIMIFESAQSVYDIEVEGVHNFGIRYGDNEESLIVSNSEYLFLNDTACNLASINLAAAYRKSYDFKMSEFQLIMELAYAMTVILDITINMASYPSRRIAELTYKHRTLGLGFTGLGEYLAIKGDAYEGSRGRSLAEDVAVYIWEYAYNATTDMADVLGPCEAWHDNEESVRAVYADKMGFDPSMVKPVRNMQLTCIAPTGTISFVMDAGSTGIEPPYALQTRKSLSEGGHMDVSLPFVDEAIRAVANNDYEIAEYMNAIDNGEIPDALKGVLATANTVSWKGHVDMMAAVQPFVCGAISKTVNMPESSSVQDVMDVYEYAFDSGIKCVALYRDKSKLSAPLSEVTSDDGSNSVEGSTTDYAGNGHVAGQRKPLPAKRKGYTQKVNIDNQSLYIRTGEYEDGSLGELFLDMGKQGGAYGGLLSAFAKSVSLGLQYGVPLDDFADAFIGSRMQPSGFVFGHDAIKMCASPIDLIFKDLELSYGSVDRDYSVDAGDNGGSGSVVPEKNVKNAYTGEICVNCEDVRLVRTGSCSTCLGCGTTTGCA